MSQQTNLNSFNNLWYKPGRNHLIRLLWYFTNAIFIKSAFPISGIKVFLLKMFGANIGIGVVIKPYVNIKYPWRLKIGNYVWIGENVWIDNLADVEIEDNVCISQGAMLLCGNHNYKKTTFDLMIGNIVLKTGSWIGAKSIVCQGVVVGSHAVLTVGSVASTNLDDYFIYRGNPAQKIKQRVVE